jgi:hypothetical protein
MRDTAEDREYDIANNKSVRRTFWLRFQEFERGASALFTRPLFSESKEQAGVLNLRGPSIFRCPPPDQRLGRCSSGALT